MKLMRTFERQEGPIMQFSLLWRSCEACACLFKCQERSGNHFATLRGTKAWDMSFLHSTHVCLVSKLVYI